MTKWDRDAADLLGAARRAGPSLRARERGKARLLAGLGVVSAAGAASMTAKATVLGASASGASAAAGASTGVAISAIGGALLIGMGLGVSVMVAAVQLSPSEKPLAVASQRSPRAIDPAPAQVASAPVLLSAPQELDEPAPSPDPRKGVGGRELSAAEKAAPSLSRETAMLASAQQALGSGRALGALAVLEQYRATFPEGALSEEAAGARILALCALGRETEGARERESFLRAHPASPLAARVSTACQGGAH